MKKNKAQKDLLYIALSSFILVALWVGSNIYHAYVTTTISSDLEQKLKPIDPTFDTQTITNIKQRQKIAPVYEAQIASSSADTTPDIDNNLASPSGTQQAPNPPVPPQLPLPSLPSSNPGL